MPVVEDIDGRLRRDIGGVEGLVVREILVFFPELIDIFSQGDIYDPAAQGVLQNDIGIIQDGHFLISLGEIAAPGTSASVIRSGLFAA